MDTIRVFIAIELAHDILSKIGRLQTRMKQDIPKGLVRWVRPEGIHLTLKFLGDAPASRVADIAGAMRSACVSVPAFGVEIGGLGCFPNTGRPRVIWVGVDEPRAILTRLHERIDRHMAGLGFPPEKRPFNPHLTLGRVKGRNREQAQALGEYVARGKARVGHIEIASVGLIRSELLPGGAVYTRLAQAPLGVEAAP